MEKKTWKYTEGKGTKHYSKTRTDKMRREGQCVGCRQKKLELNSSVTMCPECRHNYRISQNKVRDENTSKNLCKWCGTLENVKGITSCIACILKYTSRKYFKTVNRWLDLFNLFKKQNGVCPYTGDKLAIGVNCSLDHIIPRSKGGSNELSNLQWVREYVNDMKGSLDNYEFISICKMIANNEPNKNQNWNADEINNLESSILKPRIDKRKSNGKKGHNHPKSKLNSEQVLEIRKLFDNKNNSISNLAEKYNVSKSTISKVLNRTNWSHI